MCELFGVNAAKEIYLNDWLREFFAHSVNHPDGWGIARLYGNAVSLEKEPEAAYKSGYLKQRLSHPIYDTKLIAHIRKASVGSIDYCNCHPYVLRDDYGRCWTLMHNGTIFDSDILEKYTAVQHGSSDSERILYYVVDTINKRAAQNGGELSAEQRFDVLDDAIHAITEKNKVNLIFYDAEFMYVHMNMKGTLHICRRPGVTAVATVPQKGDDWQPVPLTTLMAFKDGELVRSGECRGNEYIEDPNRLKMMYIDYAQL